MAAHLRVFPHTEVPEADPQEPSVQVALVDLLPLLALAHRRNYVWLNDFLDDQVLITPDLYEVLQAFQRRPSA